MTYTKATIQEFLADVFPFSQLTGDRLTLLASQCQLLRYRLGQVMLARDEMPDAVSILYDGQIRLIGYTHTQQALTLQLLKPGAILGWVSLLRQKACETAIASTETIYITLPAEQWLQWLQQEPTLLAGFQNQATVAEVFECLSTTLGGRADSETVLQAADAADLQALALSLHAEAIVRSLRPGKTPFSQLGSQLGSQLDRDRHWFVSSGTVVNHPVGSALSSEIAFITVEGGEPARLLGLRTDSLQWLPPAAVDTALDTTVDTPDGADDLGDGAIPYARDRPMSGQPTASAQRKRLSTYPFVRGRDPIAATLACFQMLARYWELPFQREVVERLLATQTTKNPTLSLQLCGGIAELLGLNARLIEVSVQAIDQLPTPAMLRWGDSFAVLYDSRDQTLILAVPDLGVIRLSLTQFAEQWGLEGQALLLQPAKDAPQQTFNLRWFAPSLWRYRKVLLQVFVASFVVQILGLANPLVTQLIIDRVVIQNSVDTLNVLGVLVVIIALFEGLISSLRTYLFVDTTNRIDLTLGSVIIDHLLRLPLRFFERRPVGELATRANELENIRQFMTGTALTVVLDAVFSVIYIAVMAFYSWLLTLVALVTIPLFTALTLGVSPLIRRQLRDRSERNAETQSYLVEVLSGIQTVKAQNIELQTRWQWQQRYSRYVDAGFKTVITSTAAGASSNFLNQVSGLLVLWVGAYLVLQGHLSLGQLIAFRIIAGYVTNPLLRLTQLWQNFQETALSLERLGDILNASPEADAINRHNIPMPVIKGDVKYEQVSFAFNPNTPLQLTNINLHLTAGRFIGVVGQSGSGKSTLTKLLPRLYDVQAGRILIDGYDIAKVELYSLRQQIGMVLQDTLLFDGIVRENIALTNPDASAEAVIKAAQTAVAHDFIMALPQGYNTRVGERGSSLSGGQRQRIAIARTVLQQPRLLILDEATSALDYQSERQVCMNLAEAFQGRTLFFITHRLSTVRYADEILLLDQGAIVEQGTHDDLMALKGRYYHLYQQQDAQL